MASHGNRSGRGSMRTTREVIAFALGIPIDEIRPEVRLLGDLGIDVFDVQELLEALEDEFDLDLSDGEEGIRTIADIEHALQGAMGHRPALHASGLG